MDSQPASTAHRSHFWSIGLQPAVFGAICGLASAVGYTLANICLRAVTHCDPIWVSCIKAFPTVALVGPWLIVLKARGQRALPPPQVGLVLVGAALFGQLGGNVLFQTSLGIVGVALAASLTLGAIIAGGAILGRVFLREPVTPRMAASIVVLISAICVLSLGAGAAHESMFAGADSGPWWILAFGVGGACFSGVAYAVLGVAIRHGVTGKAPLSTTLFTVALVGFVTLGAISAARLGVDNMWATSSTDLGVMVMAGLFNAFAFLALTKALQLTTVVIVNGLNATQAAMAAVAGMVVFGEAMSPWLVAGVALTIVGLVLMKSRRPPPRDNDRRTLAPDDRGDVGQETPEAPAAIGAAAAAAVSARDPAGGE